MDARLVGTTIYRVLLSTDKETIVFDTDQGYIGYATQNDCCNEVWINHADGTEALENAFVFNVEESSWGDWSQVRPTRQEEEEQAFWTILTNKGRCKIEVRNSSNGYYGGQVVHLSEIPMQDMEELKEDF